MYILYYNRNLSYLVEVYRLPGILVEDVPVAPAADAGLVEGHDVLSEGPGLVAKHVLDLSQLLVPRVNILPKMRINRIFGSIINLIFCKIFSPASFRVVVRALAWVSDLESYISLSQSINLERNNRITSTETET